MCDSELCLLFVDTISSGPGSAQCCSGRAERHLLWRPFIQQLARYCCCQNNVPSVKRRATPGRTRAQPPFPIKPGHGVKQRQTQEPVIGDKTWSLTRGLQRSPARVATAFMRSGAWQGVKPGSEHFQPVTTLWSSDLLPMFNRAAQTCDFKNCPSFG